MADNSILPATGDVIAADDVGGIKYQRVKVVWGPDGTATETNTGAGFPVAVQGTVPVSGTFWQATQPVSATSLPLPTGAATEATLSAQSAKLPATLGQKAMAASLSVAIASDQGAVPVSGTFWQATQPVSLASVPSHAVTNAGTFAVQAAIGDGSDVATGAKADATWDGSAAASGISLWRYIGTKIEAVRALLAGTLTVGTHAVTQSGTWTVQPGNTANTTAWKVDGSAVTQPVSGTFWQATQPVSNAGTFATQAAQSGTWTVGLSASQTLATVTTVSTVTNLSQLGGTAIAMNTGTRSAGTQRVTIATDDVVPVSQSGTWNITNVSGTISLPTGAATAANQTSIVGTKAAGTAATNSLLAGGVYNSTTPALTDGQQVAAQVDTTGARRVSTEGGKATYRVSLAGAISSTANDIFELKGSSTKTIKITRVQLTMVNSAASKLEFFEITRRSTAASGGTPTTQTAAKLDTNNASATAVVNTFAGAPTQGTLVSTISTARVASPYLTTPVYAPQPVVFGFGDKNGQALVVRGTSDFIAMGFGSTASASSFVSLIVEWTEE